MSVSADRTKIGKDNPEECKTKLEQWLFTIKKSVTHVAGLLISRMGHMQGAEDEVEGSILSM